MTPGLKDLTRDYMELSFCAFRNLQHEHQRLARQRRGQWLQQYAVQILQPCILGAFRYVNFNPGFKEPVRQKRDRPETDLWCID